MLVAVVAGVWAGCLGTLGQEARKQSAFVWWIANRLMFLAAVTSLQGSIFYFVMYAFNLTDEGASSLTGTLTAVIGVFIIFTALVSGWISNWVGRTPAGSDQRDRGGGRERDPASGHHLGAATWRSSTLPERSSGWPPACS